MDFQRYTDDAVRAIFEGAGFEAVVVEARGDLLTVVTAAMRFFASMMPDHAMHVRRTDSLMPSSVLAVFQKTCGARQ